MYLTIVLIICISCSVNGHFHSGFKATTLFELGSQLTSLGSPEIRIKRPYDYDSETDFWNVYVGWDYLAGGGGGTDDITYFQLNIDEYGDRASSLDFNWGGLKGNFKLNPINGRPSNFKVMEGKISSCEECFLHTDIQVNITSDRDQMKLDVLLSNIHGYPRNGLFDAIPFIRLKDENEIEATLKFVIPLRSRDSPKGARADFALKVKGGIANPLHSTNIRHPNYGSKFAPGTYLLSASAKITHHGSVIFRNPRNLFKETPEIKSVLRIDMHDAVEYDDGRLNMASKLEGMDELFNIDFTMSEDLAFGALERLGDNDMFSLSMNDVNNGIDYGNIRAFFKTQDHLRIEFSILGLGMTPGNDMTTMSLNLNTTPTSTEIYLEGEEYSLRKECFEFDNHTPSTNLLENNETEIDQGDVPENNSTGSFLTSNLYQIIFGASDKNLFPSNFNECNKYKIWESIDQNDVKITRWYKDFLQLFGEYVSGQYHYYPRERQHKSQVVEQIISFNDNGYIIHNGFPTANSETSFDFVTSVEKYGSVININMNLTKIMLFDMQYQRSSKVASMDLQLHDGLGHYSVNLIKGDFVKGDEPIIDATIYDSGMTKSLAVIFNELVPRLMKITTLTRSNEFGYSSMASILAYFNMSGQESCPETCMCQSPPRSWTGRRNVQGPGVAEGYCFHWCDPSGFCGVGEVAKAEGQDCRPCRMKFYGY